MNEFRQYNCEARPFNPSFGYSVKLMVVNTVKRILEIGNGSIDILQFFKAEQTQSECPEVRPFIALQRHARGDLQSLLEEFLAVLNVGVEGVAHHDPG